MFGFRLLGLGGGAGKPVIDATGGTITQSGGFKIHTFNSPGTFSVTKAPAGQTVEFMVVAGGAGGGGRTSPGRS